MSINGTGVKYMLLKETFLHPSVNVRFDLGRSEFYERYLPTASHANVLNGLLKGFLNKGSHAHIVVGPYGSGKSLLTTIVGGIVSKSVNERSFKTLLNRFKSVDQGNLTYKYMKEIPSQPITFIPVVLNGNQGNLRRNLMVSLYSTLSEYGLDFTLPSIALEIGKTIELWKSDYSETYQSLLMALEDTHWNIEKLLADISVFDTKAIDWFKETYTKLTSGSNLSLAYDKDIITQLQFVLRELYLKGFGVFFIYDEFGRFMQTLSSEETHETMHDLQELAELANKDEHQNLHIIFISHRNMSQYALKYQNEELEKEFKKIEERFNVYYTLTDQSTFIRLANVITEDFRRGKKFDQFVTELRMFSMFTDFSLYEVDSIVIKGSYPLHPVTLFVMTHLANQVAQNERTLFTFLESDENGGLLSYYNRNKSWYRVDTIFDYFEPAISEFEKDTIVGKYYSLYQRLQRKLIDQKTSDDELRVLKMLALWNMASLHRKQLPTEDLIAFSLSWDSKKIALILQLMHEKKVVRFNPQDGYWDLFEGSPINTNLEIQNRQEELVFSNRMRMEFLTRILDNKYVLSKGYNDDINMTRFASVHAVLYSELIKKEISAEEIRSSVDSDGVIILVVDGTKEDEVNKSIKSLSTSEERTLFVSLNESSNIIDEIDKLAVVEQLLQDKYFLSQDAYLQEELNKIHNDLVYYINKNIDPVTNVASSKWCYCGEELVLNNNIELSKNLSNIFAKYYSHTPMFINESFNRRNITKIQKKSAIKVIDKILQANNPEEIEFEGSGPDSFIYKTIIKNTGINLDQPELSLNPQLVQLRNDLLDILIQKKGTLLELIRTCVGKPFGIRAPLIPLLLVSLLKTEWKYIMFYNNGVFNSDVNGELLFKMVENPEGYSFAYHPYERKYEGLIEFINEVFSEFIEPTEKELHPAVYVNRLLLRWLRSLPHISQNTNTLNEDMIALKSLVRRGEVDPDECLDKIYELTQVHGGLGYLEDIKNQFEQFYLEHSRKIREDIFRSTDTESFEILKKWAVSHSAIVRSNNFLVKCIIESDEDNWIENICEKMIGVRRENWSDATDQLFRNQIKVCLENLTDDSYKSYIEVTVGDEVLAIPQVELSTKSKLMLDNLKEDVISMGRTVSKEEVQTLLLQLLKEFLQD